MSLLMSFLQNFLQNCWLVIQTPYLWLVSLFGSHFFGAAVATVIETLAYYWLYVRICRLGWKLVGDAPYRHFVVSKPWACARLSLLLLLLVAHIAFYLTAWDSGYFSGQFFKEGGTVLALFFALITALCTSSVTSRGLTLISIAKNVKADAKPSDYI